MLLKAGGVGIELGVAEGGFSERILNRSKLRHLYSVDMYAGDRGHDIHQYRRAIKRLDIHRSRNTLIKLQFDAALELFPDNYFDFIYVDGYAHTGEEGGKTFYQWYPKLKPGGIFSGDDYDTDIWPGVVSAVDRFVQANKLPLMIIEPTEKADDYSQYPTWLTLKPRHLSPAVVKIALVGNGPVNTSLADEIDAHDLVIRINRAPNWGVAGRKTDILAIVNWSNPGHWIAAGKTPTHPEAAKAAEIWFPMSPDQIASWTHRTDPESKTENVDATDLLQEMFKDRTCKILPAFAWNDAIISLRSLGAKDEQMPSTGIVVLQYLLKAHPNSRITTYGFSHEGWSGHPWEAEKALFDNLIQCGRIRRR
jgi:hypothetical protein